MAYTVMVPPEPPGMCWPVGPPDGPPVFWVQVSADALTNNRPVRVQVHLDPVSVVVDIPPGSGVTRVEVVAWS